jgi:hypothetical protein
MSDFNFDFSANFEEAPSIKPYINIGALLDIPTGVYVKGKYGEHILNGGLGFITGVVGIGNNFKSTVMHYMMLSAMDRFPKSRANTYDTEINIQQSRLQALSYAFDSFKDKKIIDEGTWEITDKTVYYGNEWYEEWKKFINKKIDNVKKITVDFPFADTKKNDGSLIRLPYPTFSQVDSFSEFETQDVANIQNNNELGDSGGNTIHMRQGLAKIRFLSDIPKLIAKSNNPMMMTAHIGKDIPMDPRAAPVKKLQFLKNGDKIKGVTDKFMFLTSACWQCSSAVPYTNDTTKAPEYPRSPEDDMKGDTDLNIVTLTLLRNKNGITGVNVQLLVSQREGVLASLSEFHYIKTNGRYGIDGGRDHYYLDLLPNVNISRTTVRSKINESVMLKRALNITAELCQMDINHEYEQGFICTPKQLYKDLVDKGYDWDVLLNTRGWYTSDNDKHKVPFLSTFDLLAMRSPKHNYHPYWLADDKKTIKKEFIVS